MKVPSNYQAGGCPICGKPHGGKTDHRACSKVLQAASLNKPRRRASPKVRDDRFATYIKAKDAQ